MDRETRQRIGCGWELVQIKPRPWTPENLDSGWVAPKGYVDVCPGYTTKLPEVIEAARARLHWKEGGGLRDFCDDTPTDQLRVCVEILEGASNELQRWTFDNPEKRQ
jgi:hypothetical protein